MLGNMSLPQKYWSPDLRHFTTWAEQLPISCRRLLENGLYIARNKVSTYSGLGACEETPHAKKEYAKWAMLRSKLIPCFKSILL